MRRVKSRWDNTFRSSRHSASHCEKYALSEMTSSVSRCGIIALFGTQRLVVPPHGQDDLLNLQSIFEIKHFRESLSFLNIQCTYCISTPYARFANLALSRSDAPANREVYIATCIWWHSSIKWRPCRPFKYCRLPVHRREWDRTTWQRRKKLICRCSTWILDIAIPSPTAS